MRKFISITVILVITFAFIPLIGAVDKMVETEGSSIFSREDAIRQAQRLAVEEVVGVFIHSRTEIENFVLKKDKVISRTQGYITRFSVLKEEKSGDLYKVKIRAAVSLEKIKDDLVAMKILLESMERPKIMVFFKEEYSGMDIGDIGLAESALTAMIAAKGFELVDKAQVETVRNSDQARQALSGNTVAARYLGQNFGAQYVILGRAVAQDAGEVYSGSGMRSIHASLQLKIIQTQTGLILGSLLKNGVAAHVSPLTGATKAIQKTVQKAVDGYLVDAITTSFQDYLNNGAPIKLHITGVKTFRQYKLIASNILELPSVVSSRKEGWNKAGAMLVLDLRFKGTGEQLAELLDGLSLDKNELEVVDFAPERVDCNFR